jgi:type I restriction enzyme M protein
MSRIQPTLINEYGLTTDYGLSALYRRAHDMMRNIDGLQPQEAFDELLKFLFFKQANEDKGPKLVFPVEANSLSKDDTQKLAGEVRAIFADYVETFNSWFRELWKDEKFHLSDAALVTLHQLFRDVDFSKIPFDTRSTALKEFLSSEMRRGLGIYLTPDDVVKMMVEFVSPTLEQSVYDLACGSGTFLVETLKFRRTTSKSHKNIVWGTDKNPRMLLLAELNMGHFPQITFHRRVTDALFPEIGDKYQWPTANSFDVIFTNPPFGVALDNTSFDLRGFHTCRTKEGYLTNRQQSEIVFIEQSLNYLKPGGILAIVLPKSVVTNSTFQTARKALDKQGYIYAAVILPPETFATTGTQASTVVIFIHKYGSKEDRKEKVQIALANVTNVGYDSTGRARKDTQLVQLAQDLRSCLKSKSNVGLCRILPEISKEDTFSELGNLLAGRISATNTAKLRDVVELVTNGRTPPRLSYTDEGLFVVKVGNLTGNGINWIARERNFIGVDEKEKRQKSKQLMLRKGDILLTAAAHSPVYIAKKVDILETVPEWVGGSASFVGEVMLIRPNQKLIDPYILLAYLRMPTTTERLQTLIRGQTAHLYASDILELPLPFELLEPNRTLKKAADLLRRETELNSQLNEYAFEQQQLLGSMVF